MNNMPNALSPNALSHIKELAAILGLLSPQTHDGQCKCVECEYKSYPTLDLEKLPPIVANILETYDGPKIVVSPKIEDSRYQLWDDVVVVDAIENRRNMNDFLRLLFHELGHSTGTKKRLNRVVVANSEYQNPTVREHAIEEIIAELTSQKLLNFCRLGDDMCRRLSDSYILSYADRFWKHERKDIDEVIAMAEPFAENAFHMIAQHHRPLNNRRARTSVMERR